MKNPLLVTAVFMSLLLLFSSCASTTPPTPTQHSTQTPSSTPTLTAPKTTSLTAEEAAWQKVMAEAKKEGKVTLYTFRFTGDIGTSVAKAFQGKYEIQLEFVTGVGTVLIERLKTERAAKKYIADTLDTAPSVVYMATQDGLTEKVGELPVLRERDVWTMGPPLIDPEGHITGGGANTYTVYVNTTLVKSSEEPKSYRELLEPKWKGKITLDSPVTSPVQIWLYLVLGKAKLLDDEYWRRLAMQELKIGPSNREPPLWVSRGEAYIHHAVGEQTMAPMAKEGAPVKAVEMQEGVVVAPGAWSIAPLSNAARVFINWILSQEGQITLNEALGGLTPMRKDVPDIRPATLRLTPRKVQLLGIGDMLEATQLQRDGTLARLLGLWSDSKEMTELDNVRI